MPEAQTSRNNGESLSGSRRFSLRQRLAIWLISWVASLLIRIIGCTLRFEVVRVDQDGADGYGHIPTGIYCFWHRCVIPAAYRFRNHQIAIMVSQSFDGELIARTVSRMGFRPVRGSSSRGGAGALLSMRTELEQGHSAVFTADGPRGPIYVAKPGPVALARHTGHKIMCFHMAVQNAWVLKSWDRMIIPKPFSRVVLHGSHSIQVPPDATDEQMAQLHQQMQSELDKAREGAERRVSA
jgi:lysophospholipid acyltransferase (LPLAT)-like uncharacterized protein